MAKFKVGDLIYGYDGDYIYKVESITDLGYYLEILESKKRSDLSCYSRHFLLFRYVDIFPHYYEYKAKEEFNQNLKDLINDT